MQIEIFWWFEVLESIEVSTIFQNDLAKFLLLILATDSPGFLLYIQKLQIFRTGKCKTRLHLCPPNRISSKPPGSKQSGRRCLKSKSEMTSLVRAQVLFASTLLSDPTTMQSENKHGVMEFQGTEALVLQKSVSKSLFALFGEEKYFIK